MFSYTQPREAIIDYDRWFLKKSGSWQATSVAAGKRHGKLVVAQLEGVEDRDQAAELVGCDIAVARNDLPKAEDGSYYWADLEGLQVVHRDGTEIGRVAYLMDYILLSA